MLTLRDAIEAYHGHDIWGKLLIEPVTVYHGFYLLFPQECWERYMHNESKDNDNVTLGEALQDGTVYDEETFRAFMVSQAAQHIAIEIDMAKE